MTDEPKTIEDLKEFLAASGLKPLDQRQEPMFDRYIRRREARKQAQREMRKMVAALKSLRR